MCEGNNHEEAASRKRRERKGKTRLSLPTSCSNTAEEKNKKRRGAFTDSQDILIAVQNLNTV